LICLSQVVTDINRLNENEERPKPSKFVDTTNLTQEEKYLLAFEYFTNPDYNLKKTAACERAGIHHSTYAS
jgi:hypothetical protein